MSKLPLSSLLASQAGGRAWASSHRACTLWGHSPVPWSSCLAWTESDSLPRPGALTLSPSQAELGDLWPTDRTVFTEQPLI